MWKVARNEPCQANVIRLHPYLITLYRSQAVRHNNVSNKCFNQLNNLGGESVVYVNSHLETQPKRPCLKVILIGHSLIGNFQTSTILPNVSKTQLENHKLNSSQVTNAAFIFFKEQQQPLRINNMHMPFNNHCPTFID